MVCTKFEVLNIKDAPIIVILMILVVCLVLIHSPLALGKWCNVKTIHVQVIKFDILDQNRVLIPLVVSN